jgi:hypothetical protein
MPTNEILTGMQRQNEERFELIARNLETVLDSIERLATASVPFRQVYGSFASGNANTHTAAPPGRGT